MDKETFFFTLFAIWYLRQYGPPHFVVLNTIKLYHNAIHYLNIYNCLVYPDYFSYKKEEQEEEQEEINVKEKMEEVKPEPKYEDKYLNEIRKLSKEYEFDENEEKLKNQKNIEFQQIIKKEYLDKIEEFKDKLGKIEIKLTKYESSDEDYCICDDEDDDSNLGITKEERIKILLEEQKKIIISKQDYKQEYESEEGQQNNIKKSQEMSRDFIIKQRLDKLKNCFVMEYTPLGNVLMIYDIERESFKFYSDNTIPYRYLEVAARKYVKQFGCRPIFVDMEEELKLAEEKWDKERKEKDEKEEEERRKKEESIKNKKPIEEKKNVFAKFKSYNKESGTGHVNIAAPPKNSIPNKNLTSKQENEKTLLKDKANRYTYEGKIANFSFIKKIDRKVVDKKFNMSFADFKKKLLSK
jgi:hypothetical protein